MTVPNVRIALIGMGRMGLALDALAATRQCEVVARFGTPSAERPLTGASLSGAQVALEFTAPSAAVDNVLTCLRAHCPVVVGTTGWGDRLAELQRAVDEYQCPVVVAPNFSLGVQVFLAVAEDAGRRLRHLHAFDAHIVEIHHAGKQDAPSGTGLAVRDRVSRGLSRDVPVTSVRTGSVPGAHEVIFDAPFEQIRIAHEARDRRVFADGALVAARWLANNRRAAVYSMQDVLADLGE